MTLTSTPHGAHILRAAQGRRERVDPLSAHELSFLGRERAQLVMSPLTQPQKATLG